MCVHVRLHASNGIIDMRFSPIAAIAWAATSIDRTSWARCVCEGVVCACVCVVMWTAEATPAIAKKPTINILSRVRLKHPFTVCINGVPDSALQEGWVGMFQLYTPIIEFEAYESWYPLTSITNGVAFPWDAPRSPGQYELRLFYGGCVGENIVSPYNAVARSQTLTCPDGSSLSVGSSCSVDETYARINGDMADGGWADYDDSSDYAEGISP